ncbi:MAG TPA: hypothetical protein VGM96_13345 [Reyranella sp.]|jgi:hypothetical protein
MSGDGAAASAATTKAEKPGNEGRQRSSIAFPYDDLNSAIELAQAIYSQVGLGDCDDDQLAAWTNQSPKSSGYRTQIATARLCGLFDSGTGRYRLSALGRAIVDPNRARESRVRAFLNVPLFSAVFENYKGSVLPPASALERDMVGMGVADKMKDRARRVFERSAEQAGFFEQGRNRLVMPGVALRGDDAFSSPSESPEPEHHSNDSASKRSSGGGGGGGIEGFHPFIQGLLKTLPDPDSDQEWNVEDRVKWLQTAANIFDLIYKGDGGIKVEPAMATRSPRG